jgi:hypothetical protein
MTNEQYIERFKRQVAAWGVSEDVQERLISDFSNIINTEGVTAAATWRHEQSKSLYTYMEKRELEAATLDESLGSKLLRQVTFGTWDSGRPTDEKRKRQYASEWSYEDGGKVTQKAQVKQNMADAVRGAIGLSQVFQKHSVFNILGSK